MVVSVPQVVVVRGLINLGAVKACFGVAGRRGTAKFCRSGLLIFSGLWGNRSVVKMLPALWLQMATGPWAVAHALRDSPPSPGLDAMASAPDLAVSKRQRIDLPWGALAAYAQWRPAVHFMPPAGGWINDPCGCAIASSETVLFVR